MSPALIAMMYVVGIALILFELLTPGVIVGLLGSTCLGIAVYGTFQYGILAGLLGLVLSVVFGAAVMIFAVRKLTATGMQDKDQGYRSADPTLQELFGTEGRATTPLQPSGYCSFDGRRVQVVSRGEPIDQGTQVRVVEVEGSRVVVEGV
ncbi:MAG: NfeD family protein [Planctomycetota bacterium]|jgi:membrane-bound serine protease (ClpP class)